VALPAALSALFDRYFAAYAAHDDVGCAAVYETDATVLSPWGPPARGQGAIRAAHRTWFAEGETDKSYSVVSAQVTEATATVLLVYSATLPSGERIHGTSLNTLRRDPEGTWRITYCSLNDLDDPQALACTPTDPGETP